MKFTGIGNEVIEFRILGYELPENPGPSYEANFLYIELNVQSKIGNWQTDNCALSTTDVEKVIDWFYKLWHGDIPIGNLEFIDKGISFEYVNKTDRQVHFRILLHPVCIPENISELNSYPISFDLGERDLEAVYNSLRAELEAFPTRGFEE